MAAEPEADGVLRLPVTDNMIDGWLLAVDEVEAPEGGELFDVRWINLGGSGINLKTLLDDPPAKFDVLSLVVDRKIDAKYLGKLTDENLFDVRVFDRSSSCSGTV